MRLAYCIYITDSLQNIPQNKYLTSRWIEMVFPHAEDDRSGEDIALEFIKRAGLKVE